MIHTLKTWPEFFKDVKEGRKTFEFRAFDRPFKVGDTLHLVEFDPLPELGGKGLTGDFVDVQVTYLLHGGGIVPEGYCCMSISLVGSRTYHVPPPLPPEGIEL